MPEEIDRCQELLAEYAAIGPAGNFGVAMIKIRLSDAVRAMAAQDTVAMLRACEALKGCE